MIRTLLAIALVGCSSPARVAPRPPPPPAPRIDPAIAGLVGSVGPSLRVVAKLDLKERSVGRQLENLESALAIMGGKTLAACHVSLAQLRIAVGEPLRISAEIDGDIDTARLPCLLGERLFATLGQFDLLVTDRKGGIAISRESQPGVPDAALVDRCEGASCLAVEVGPRDHRVDFAIRFGDPVRFAITGVDLAKLTPATQAMFGASFPVKLHGDAHGMSGELARDADPSWAADFKSRLVEAFKIPSSSMRPTLVEGDHIFAVKGALAGPVTAGDVIVYRTDEDRTYVKRVIATGGQTVSETADGIEVDGVKLPITVLDPAKKFYEEDPERGMHVDKVGALVRESIGTRSYLTLRTGPPRELKSWTVPAGQFFVLGDNRNNSNDSRYTGAIAPSAIVGRAAGIWLAIHDGIPDWDRMGSPVD